MAEHRKPTLCIGILTLNEAHRIARCIQSASFADQVVVIDSGSEEMESVRTVSPTGPFVSVVSTGRAASTPSAISRATTPLEMIQTASLSRTKARPNASETVSIWLGRLATPLAIRKFSTTGRMIEPRVGINSV